MNSEDDKGTVFTPLVIIINVANKAEQSLLKLGSHYIIFLSDQISDST